MQKKHATQGRAEATKTSDQSARFIEAAREAGCSEDEAVFDAALRKIVNGKPKDENREPTKQSRSHSREAEGT